MLTRARSAPNAQPLLNHPLQAQLLCSSQSAVCFFFPDSSPGRRVINRSFPRRVAKKRLTLRKNSSTFFE